MEPLTVFRRFDTFEEAQTFAASERKVQRLRGVDCGAVSIVYSPPRSTPNDLPDGNGPWCVETKGSMIRSWEALCAVMCFAAGERAKFYWGRIRSIQRALA